MYSNLINDNSFYCIIICSGIFISGSLLYFVRTNYFAIPTQNVEELRQEDTDAIMNANAENEINNENIYAEYDSDTDTDISSYYQDSIHSENSTDFENILEDHDLFFMPNVDFNVCPIEELKLFEFKSLYARELIDHSISDDEIMEFLSWYSQEDLATNWINDRFLATISIL